MCINMHMKSNELVFNILKYDHPTPAWIREKIDEVLEKTTLHNDFDWEDMPSDNSLGDIKVQDTHFFTLFVYYDRSFDGTVVNIKIKDLSYAKELSKFYTLTGKDFYTIYCDGMDETEFVDEFTDVINNFYRFCLHQEYIEEYPDD